MVPISEWVRTNRESRGWTQLDLAAQANCYVGSISRWERGENAPSLEQFRLLCLCFRRSADEALGLPAYSRGRRRRTNGVAAAPSDNTPA